MLFLFIVALCNNTLSAGDIFNIKSMKIAAGYPAEFLINLIEDDNFTVTYKVIGGSGISENLEVYLVNLNNTDEEVIKEFKNRSDFIRVPTSGLYKLVFKYKGQTRFSWRKSKYLNVSVKAESLLMEELGPGESRQILRIQNLAIDEQDKNVFRVIYPFSKGDQLYISSGDQKASFVKLEILQLGINKFLNSLSSPINIPKDGLYTFDIYLEENKEATGLYQTLASLLSNNDVNFSDLIITHEKGLVEETIFNNNSGDIYNNENSNGSENGQEDLAEDPNARFNNLLEQMSDDNSTNSEMNKFVIQQIMENQKNLNEMFKKKESVEVAVIAKNTDPIKLGPVLNFDGNTRKKIANRECQELKLPGGGGGRFNFWFYWIGVGEKAEEAFNMAKERYTQEYGKNLLKQKANYIFYSNNQQPELAGVNPPFPKKSDPRFNDFFTEDVEYAVVNRTNMELFLKGKPYSRRNSFRKKYVFADEGIAILPQDKKDTYYICTCNNNKNTAIDVFFAYFTIATSITNY